MTLTTQFYTMLAMAGMGAWLGASLDTYRLFVIRAKTAKWLLFIHDILFWMVQGLLFFYVLLNVNEGELRVYIFLAVLLGIATYQSLCKRIYIKILTIAIHLAVSLYQFIKKLIQHVLFRPVVLLCKLLIGLVTFILLYCYRIIAFLVKCLFKILQVLIYPLLKLFPEKWRHTFKRYFQKSAGILTKNKKLIITIKTAIQRMLKR